jgi:hypothetical protein
MREPRKIRQTAIFRPVEADFPVDRPLAEVNAEGPNRHRDSNKKLGTKAQISY